MRPTGRLHLGHYFGALSNWLKLQEEYDCFFFVADWHALTTHYEDTSSIAENTLQIAMDWLSVGLDPEKSTLFIQSRILEHAELHLILSMITPLSWLERVPTYKEQIENLKDRDLGTYGFLGYPLLQTADIVMYGDPRQDLLVPVGEDQVPHVELSREVVRKFNFNCGIRIDVRGMETDKRGSQSAQQGFFLLLHVLDSLEGRGSDSVFGSSVPDVDVKDIAQRIRRIALSSGFVNIEEALRRLANEHQIFQKYVRFEEVLREPNYLLTETPRLPGLDGRRMAKSYGNAIWLTDPPDEIRTKVRNMMTDPQRQRRTDPGRPEICPVFAWHKLFSPPETIAWSEEGCRTAGIGCVQCKAAMADNLAKWIEPIQVKRKELESRPQKVWDILDAGSKMARKTAESTMERVRNAVFKWDEAQKAR
jgi:tryptophanyl-tRNA synthetase